MKNSLVWMVVLATLGSETLFAQRGEPVNSLARARATFDATDSNKDGKVSFEELKSNAMPIQKADFDTQDNDKDGTWSRDEFVVYYRQVLVSGGQRAGDDLEGEVARIQALRKAKAAESGAKNGARANAQKTPKVNPPEPANLEDRLARAIDDLEKRAAARQATRDDFERVRGAMLDRAKMAGAVDPAGEADIQARFAAALEALEKNARLGNYSREEFTGLRATLIKRGREAAKNVGDVATVPAQPANPAAQQADIEGRLQHALDELEKKAEARQATREDFNRVRDLYTQRAKAAMTAGDASTVAEENALAVKFATAIDELEKQAAAGNWSREQFNTLRQGLIRRGRAAAGGTPGVVDSKQVDTQTAASKSAESKGAESKGAELKGAEAKAGGEGIEARFELALATLEQKALARGATREDFGRVRDLLEVRARQAVKGSDGVSPADANDPAIAELVAKVKSALERLEKASADGSIKPEDFAALRQMIVRRARSAASNGGPADGRGAVDTSSSTSGSSSTKAAGGTTPPVTEKPVETKPVEAKPADPKPAEPKPVDPKPVPAREGKPAPVPPPEPPKGEEKPVRPSTPPHAELRTRG